MIGTSRSGYNDALTRTTLLIDGSLSAPSIVQLVHALQRVPGVLLAEMNAATFRAVVAHDSAVPTASLVAAAADAGACATIVTEMGYTAVRASVTAPIAGIRFQRLLLVVAALTLIQALIGALNPSIAKHHGLLPILLSCIWVFLVFSFASKRRT